MEAFSPFLEKSLNTTEYKVLPLAGDASSRKYSRIVFEDNSYILMSWEPFQPESYPFLTVGELFARHDVQVPKIIGQDGELGLLLIEDLGDLTLERKFWEFQDQKNILPYYEKSIEELIKIQFLTTSSSDKSCIAFQTKFDHDKFLWEFNYSFKHLFEGVLKFKFEDSFKKELSSVFSQVSERLASHSNHIAHRDYHSRNLMIKWGDIKVIDFQDARLGPLQYDLVSLLQDSYVNLNTNSQNHLINYYKEFAKSHSMTSVASEEFDEIYKIQTIQRCLKACGSFASFYMLRNDKRYLKYLDKTLNTVFSELIELNSLNPLVKLINDSGALSYDYGKL